MEHTICNYNSAGPPYSQKCQCQCQSKAKCIKGQAVATRQRPKELITAPCACQIMGPHHPKRIHYAHITPFNFMCWMRAFMSFIHLLLLCMRECSERKFHRSYLYVHITRCSLTIPFCSFHGWQWGKFNTPTRNQRSTKTHPPDI